MRTWIEIADDLESLSNEVQEKMLDELYKRQKKTVGKWIMDGCIEKCNICGERRDFPHWEYCPNCGAKMEEE